MKATEEVSLSRQIKFNLRNKLSPLDHNFNLSLSYFTRIILINVIQLKHGASI